jgi:hypothetical protein
MLMLQPDNDHTAEAMNAMTKLRRTTLPRRLARGFWFCD